MKTTHNKNQPTVTAAMTISQFCHAYGISRNLFYTLKKEGRAPKIICLGARRIISVDAAAEWQKSQEG